MNMLDLIELGTLDQDTHGAIGLVPDSVGFGQQE
jgi:hypothetical protein